MAAPPDEAAIARVKLVIFDVDGTLTDGRIVLDSEGRESKFFHVRDGAGIVILHKLGLKTAIISGRESAVTAARARELGISEVVQGRWDKVEAYRAVKARQQVEDEEVAFMGDDILDVPLLRAVGLPAAPADAVPEAIAAARFVARAKGGHGAARELCDLIVDGKGLRPKLNARLGL